MWKYRLYYESNSGKRHYGEWVGIDPTNTSYFEPTVYTYPTSRVEYNAAEVKGYAMRGTDNVTKQGFKYWKKSSSRGAKGVPAEGYVMLASLVNLEYNTEYYYVAFATTSGNETFYGQQQTFKTGAGNPNGIDAVERQKGVTEVARYDMNGVRLETPHKGMNIIRMSDGTTKKVMVK